MPSTFANTIQPPLTASNVINLTGKNIIPGLFDMHAHVANVLKNSYNQSESEYMLSMLLAYGVTTIRNPGGPTEQSVALKENVSEGKNMGPQIFATGQLLITQQTLSQYDINSVVQANQQKFVNNGNTPDNPNERDLTC